MVKAADRIFGNKATRNTLGTIENGAEEATEKTISKNGENGVDLSEEVAAKSGSTAANRLGQQMHKAYKVDQVLDGVRIKEFMFPSGKRADFIDFEKRIIYELKPNNPREKKLGKKQLEMYRQEAVDVFGGVWTTVLDTY